jgi:hypothetical protein
VKTPGVATHLNVGVNVPATLAVQVLSVALPEHPENESRPANSFSGGFTYALPKNPPPDPINVSAALQLAGGDETSFIHAPYGESKEAPVLNQ